ncbi:hypothetical protein [Staphylococcus delphini]|uniref:hypothetical protein n=1 Tax=Staphylococcus delphini TaxID=53344 RepID=UPI0023B29669|nr:hypothetical protein [Staphylococcus delphini]MDE9753174.1 hypothetical protein [Staphylococcus delphini]MDE9790392.1 hypothetical protein [Staphylococcus delphini]MDE9792468.1 hypothetical protein [Staphylococcus delphini]MDE9795185.1 hypothetical protein [Staphylococcus delphini]MDE9797292.1 hypothetical protein [Staphylococcus delphini]
MNNTTIKLTLSNEMSEQEARMFQQDNIADVITMLRSKSGNTIILKNEDSFKIEYSKEDK